MNGTLAGDDPGRSTTRTGWQVWADRLARVAFVVLVTDVGTGLLLGALTVLTWSDPPWTATSWRNLAFLLAALGYILALLLSLPSLVVGGYDLIGNRFAPTGRPLVFVGTFAVAFGFEGLSHLLFLRCDVTPWLCRPSQHEGVIGGLSIYEQWHLLHHSLVAALCLLLYWLALRRWHPAVAGLRVPGRSRGTQE